MVLPNRKRSLALAIQIIWIEFDWTRFG